MEILKAYTTRVFLANSQQHITELVDLLARVYGVSDLKTEKIVMKADDREATFERLTIKDLPPIYMILVENPRVGPRRIKSVFDLVAYGKGAPAIVYVHHSAISNFKLAILHNFPIILFHKEEEFRSYFESKRLGSDAKELVFVLAQKQDYVMNQIVFREDFAHMKEEKSNKREKKGEKRAEKVIREEIVKDQPRETVRFVSSPLKQAAPKTPSGNQKQGFVEAARKNLNPKAADKKQPARTSRDTTTRQPWSLPIDAI